MAAESSTQPEMRWGIIATGMIASWFVEDLVINRPDAPVLHKVVAVGSSSVSKAEKFVRDFIPSHRERPACYGSYAEVYADQNVDVVYIATPHAFHRQNCLDAITAGKHVLCEKPFTVNAGEARQVAAMARSKPVYVMEGVWTRFLPLTKKLQTLLHEQKVIGDVHRIFCDFGLDMPLAELPKTSRLKDRALGAGTLLDIGIYPLTWALLALETPGQCPRTSFAVHSAQTLSDGIDVMSSIILHHPTAGTHAILTSTALYKTDDLFCRIEGSKGTISISGPGASMPETIMIDYKPEDAAKDMGDKKRWVDGDRLGPKKEILKFSDPFGARGFHHEADAFAMDIVSGKTESSVMPLSETCRVMEIMDSIRKNGGATYPQDLQD